MQCFDSLVKLLDNFVDVEFFARHAQNKMICIGATTKRSSRIERLFQILCRRLQNHVAGIDVELAEKIAEKLDRELQIDDMDFDSALLAVQNGKSDIVMSGVSITETRLAVMDFSDPYTTAVQVIIVPEGSDITLENLGEHIIATQRATTGNIYCTDEFGDEHVLAYDNGMTAVQALMNGQADCVVIDNEPAKAFVAQNPGLMILDTEYVTEEYAIGIGKNNTELKDAINQALAELEADGTIQAIKDKYISAD